MRISYDWLKRYVELPEPAEVLAARLTLAGLAVAGVEAGPAGDRVLELEVGWNRPDWLSHLGVAREVAGIYGLPLRFPQAAPAAQAQDGPPALGVAVEAPDRCPLYTARVVRGLRVAPSPPWLARLLEAAGQRPVNNVVDVTNFVLLETGQPLHAFDLAKLAGPRLVARRAEGAPFTAIDGSRLELAPEDLVIADARGPVALAGVMGGLDTEVGPGTTEIALESALFAPLGVRATARRHQIRSESSHRFERFVDPEGVRRASDRAADLLVEVCGARHVGPLLEAGPGPRHVRPEVALRTARVARLLGVEVPEPEIRQVLGSLGFEERPGPGAGTTLWRAPSFRSDVRQEVDLIEEVARRIGFDRIPGEVALPVRPLVPDPARRAEGRLRDALVASGLRECSTAPFVGEGLHDVALFSDLAALRVENPMRAEESLLRRSLLGPLLLVAKGNRDRGVRGLRLFETAPVYLREADPRGTVELPLVAGVLEGDYADAKGCVEAALEALGLEQRVRYRRGAPEPLGRDRTATVLLDGEVAGFLGELGPEAASRFGLEAPLALFELRRDRLVERADLDRPYERVSRYPPVERDLAWVVAEDVAWGRIAEVVREAAAGLLARLELLSVFRSPQVGEGRKSVAFRMELRAPDRTLTGQDADRVVDEVVRALGLRTGGGLRS